jgi:two-component system, sensor histidine kinase and response regulator
MLHSKPAFDRQALFDVLGGDETLLRELLHLYRKEAPRLQQAVRSAVAQGNADAIRLAAHALKGTLANLAAPDAYTAAETLEALGRAEDIASAPAALAELEHQLERLHAELAPAASPEE